MESQTKTFELQIDNKPRGAVIRLNDETGCVVRICGIPKEMVYDEHGNLRKYIDITFPMKDNPDVPETNKIDERVKDCIKLEMFFNGDNFIGSKDYNKDFNIHTSELTCSTDEQWKKIIKNLSEELKKRKELNILT